MESDSEYRPVLPFREFQTCPKCGATRGRSEQAKMKFHAALPELRAPNQPDCPFGPAEHLHLVCPWCQHEFGSETAEQSGLVVAPLSNAEILELRKLIVLMRDEAPSQP